MDLRCRYIGQLAGSFLDRGKPQGRLRPSELMVSLHTIEARDEKQIRAVIQAIYLCFKESDIYTHEVLAGVLQQLLDMTPIPTLFMRTVSCIGTKEA